MPLILAASALGYGLMALWFPLVANTGLTPPGDIRTFAPTWLGGLLYAALLVALFGLLVLAARHVWRRGLGQRPLRFILLGSLLLALPLVFSYPINATDIFGYVIRSRIASAYGENPFYVTASTFQSDPFVPLLGEWATETTPYGPLWEFIGAGLTTLGGDNMLANVLLFKGLALGCFLLVTVLIWNLLPDEDGREGYTLLWAWNPALLLTFILNGHNDALMLLWLVLGYWLAQHGRTTMGSLVMILAVLTKPVALLALPFFFLEYLRDMVSREERLRYIATVVAGGAVLAWLAFLPWAGPEGILQTPVESALRLIREATGGASFSPAVWVYMILGQRVPFGTIGHITQALFVAFAVWLLWRAWRGRPSLRSASDVFLGYTATALNFRIWYAVWPFPWLLLDAANVADAPGRTAKTAAYRLRAGLWFMLAAQISVVLYGHLRVFALGGDHTLAHLLAVPIVFMLPWLLALLPAGWRGAKSA